MRLMNVEVCSFYKARYYWWDLNIWSVYYQLCKRNDQHSKATRNPTGTTNQGDFYQKFPDENVEVERQLGIHQDVRQYFGFAFHPDDNLECLTNKTNGIFEWDNSIMGSIKNSKKQDKSVVDFQIEMVAYPFEFVYDLCLSWCIRVSRIWICGRYIEKILFFVLVIFFNFLSYFATVSGTSTKKYAIFFFIL